MKKYYVYKENMFNSLAEVRKEVRGEMVEVVKREDLQLLIETMKFYADEENWYITTADKGVPVPHCPTSNDWSDKAREALEKIKPKNS